MISRFYSLRAGRGCGLVLALFICIAALSSAQRSKGQNSVAAIPAAQPDPESPATGEQIQAGKTLFAAQCGFCHGRDAGGGESGPDLMASTLVEQDVHGEKIGPVVRNGRLDKGMPAFGNVDE